MFPQAGYYYFQKIFILYWKCFKNAFWWFLKTEQNFKKASYIEEKINKKPLFNVVSTEILLKTYVKHTIRIWKFFYLPQINGPLKKMWKKIFFSKALLFVNSLSTFENHNQHDGKTTQKLHITVVIFFGNNYFLY